VIGDAAAAALVVECAGAGQRVPSLAEDESYTLDVTGAQARLRAPTVVGGLRGLETLLQLLQNDSRGFFLPVVSIHDQPRFPWRGLMIDVSRHWQPSAVIKRNLDGMALVKLNVLHLHLTDDQGFRIESKTFPRLHEMGSTGNYFTKEEMRDLIAYATDRGIRVVPEFDIPGHATSWVVGYPELAAAPGPYPLQDRWGIFDAVLDPTNEATYTLLDGFLGEMAALFPDAYLHIGGDENNGKQWSANAQIQNFIKEHDLKDNAGLHAYFNRRVGAILTKYGKTMIGWDEILHPDLPKGAVVHSWRGVKGLADAARQGHAVLLSNGYYIDHLSPAVFHYQNDPLPAATPLTLAEQQRVLGGEATMWAEWATPETIDSRIWPRTAAIAERLWSPREVADVRDMYRRLALVSRRLEESGLQHEKNRDPMLRRLAGDAASPAELGDLRSLVDLIEPVKIYRRSQEQKGVTQFTSLTGIVDCARPESDVARQFSDRVNDLLFGADAIDPAQTEKLAESLQDWSSIGQRVANSVAARSPRLRELVPLAESLVTACAIGREALDALTKPGTLDASWAKPRFDALTLAAKPGAACELPMIPSLRLLVAAAGEQAKRAALSNDAWKQDVQATAFPVQPTAGAR
jgi:hexosaminidase